MTPEARAQVRAALTSMREQLQETMAQLEAAPKNVSLELSSIGRLSRMDSMGNLAINARLLGQSRTRLHLLNEALRRVDDEDFGLCDECGAEIPLGRLLAMPETRLCVACAS